jgi:hypothetical protein
MRENLFRTPFDSALTIVVCAIALILGIQFVLWIAGEAQWAAITDNFRGIMQGLYPIDQGWRLADFNLEQQGDIASTYYQRICHGQEARAWLAFARQMGEERLLCRHPLNPRLFSAAMLANMPNLT